jgi:hypothetical protein
VFVSEEELTVEITQVDSIKIDNVNLSETGHDQVFEQFASNAAGANEERSRLKFSVSSE